MMVIAQNCEAAEAEIDLMPWSFSSARVHSALLDIKMIWETASRQTRHSAQLSAQHLNPLQAVNHVWNSQMCPRPEEINWKEPANNQPCFVFFPWLVCQTKVFWDNLLMTLKSKCMKQHFPKPTITLSHATQSFCVLRWLRLQIIVSSRFRLLCTCGAAPPFESFAVFCSNSKANLANQTSLRRHKSLLFSFFFS